MRTSDEIRSWLREAVAQAGFTVAELVKESKVNRSTVYRVLSDDYEFTPSARTLDSLFQAVTQLSALKAVRAVRNFDSIVPDVLPVTAEIGAGIWHETEAVAPEINANEYLYSLQQYSGTSPFTYNARLSRDSQWVTIVRGDSSNLECRDGDLVHWFSGIAMDKVDIEVGNLAVVSRFQPVTAGFELRIYKVDKLFPSGDVSLVAPTDNVRHAGALVLPARGRVDIGPHRVSIVGLIMALHRTCHYMAR